MSQSLYWKIVFALHEFEVHYAYMKMMHAGKLKIPTSYTKMCQSKLLFCLVSLKSIKTERQTSITFTENILFYFNCLYYLNCLYIAPTTKM